MHRQRRFAGLLGIAGIACAVAVGTAVTAPAQASSPDKSPQDWSATHHRPPDDTSAAGGVAAKTVNTATGRMAVIARYDTGLPPTVVDAAKLPASGNIIGANIDDSGTIVVVAARAHAVFDLVWPEGGDPSGWTRLASYPNPDNAVGVFMDSDDAGDVGVFHTAAGGGAADTELFAWVAADGQWVGPKTIHVNVAPGGSSPVPDLAPTGELVDIATKQVGDVTTATLLRRPLLAADWTKHKVIQQSTANVKLAEVKAGTTSDAAAFALETSHKSVIGFVSDGAVHRHRIYQGFGSTFFMNVDGPGVARFFVAHAGLKYGALTYDGGWTHSVLDGPAAPFSLLLARSDEAGDLIVTFAATRHFDRLSALIWRPGEQPSTRSSVTSRRLVLDDAAWLDSGEIWVRGTAVHGTARSTVWLLNLTTA